MNMTAAIWKNQKIIPILIILRMKWERFISVSYTHLDVYKRQPKIIAESFAEIRPRVISCVPLIVEKIFKKNILPKVDNKLGKRCV